MENTLDNESISYKIIVSLKGSYTATKTLDFQLDESVYSVNFDKIPVGSKLYVQADIYLVSAGEDFSDNNYYEKHLYTGQSEIITITQGNNLLELNLEKVIATGEVGFIDVTLLEYSSENLEISSKIANDVQEITFAVDGDYENYIWQIDNKTLKENNNTITISVEDYEVGFHSVLVVVTDSEGNYYSGKKEFIITTKINEAGLEIKVPEYESREINLNCDFEEEENVYTFSVGQDYTSYIWNIDGKTLEGENAGQISLSKENYGEGLHQVLVVVTDSEGNYYSGKKEFIITTKINEAGLEIKVPEYESREINLNCDFEEAEGVYTFSVGQDYTSYIWNIDGRTVEGENAGQISLSKEDYGEGLHQVLVVVTDSEGNYYSGKSSFSFI